MIEQDWRQVQPIKRSVIRGADASQSQAGGEQVHHVRQLETHLQAKKNDHGRQVSTGEGLREESGVVSQVSLVT